MRRLCLTLVAVLALGTAQAQQADSLHLDEHHSLQARQAIVPTALIATGALVHAIEPLHNVDVGLRDAIQSWQLPKVHADDYLQYLPMAAALGLNLTHAKSTHACRDLVPLIGGSYLIGGLAVLSIKELAHVQRPDLTSYNSFPSGHTLTAFVGAEILRREYGRDHPAIAATGYLFATGIGLMRVYNRRHWMADVLGGAGIAMLSVAATYKVYPILNNWMTHSRCQLRVTPLSATLTF